AGPLRERRGLGQPLRHPPSMKESRSNGNGAKGERRGGGSSRGSEGDVAHARLSTPPRRSHDTKLTTMSLARPMPSGVGCQRQPFFAVTSRLVREACKSSVYSVTSARYGFSGCPNAPARAKKLREACNRPNRGHPRRGACTKSMGTIDGLEKE